MNIHRFIGRQDPHLTLDLMAVVISLICAQGGSPALAQDYPFKPIRIVTGATSGGPDLVARLIAPEMSNLLGQQVVVDNRASGVIPGTLVSSASPDGYTILVTTGIVWILPLLQKTPFDPLKDFSPITLAVSSPNILVVHPSVNARSVKELIALAKAGPGQINYATGGSGGTAHLAAELFKAMTNVDIVRVNYKGGGPALNDLIGGHVQIMFATAGSVAPHLKSNKLRGLAVTTGQPSALFPDLPTVAASGVLGYESASIYGIFAPANTPTTVIRRLNSDIVRILQKPEMKQKFISVGVDVVASPPQKLSEAMKAETISLGKIIKDIGIHAE